MPAIRDEEWFLAPSYSEGVEALLTGEHESVRFCGLMLGEESGDADNLNPVFDSLSKTQAKSVSIDWLDVSPQVLKGLENFANAEETPELNSFHLTMIDLGTMPAIAPVCSIISNNLKIMDLILTFCRINDETVKPLATALSGNRTILSLNMNFNLLKKDGYITLGEGLASNNTLRYLEVKSNKAGKEDLKPFMRILDRNHHLELIDIGQNDDIDGNILPNTIPEEEKPTKKKSDVVVIVPQKPVAVENGNDQAIVPANPPAAGADNPPAVPDIDLIDDSKRIVDRNRGERRDREKGLKMEHLNEALASHTKDLSSALKHCKILFLGDKGCGKTFFAHCLVHQLYEAPAPPTPAAGDANPPPPPPPERKLDHLSFVRTTELGWTKIKDFKHVDLALARYISAKKVNKENRFKANEVCFQFAEDVTIEPTDLSFSILDKEDQRMLEKMKLDGSKTSESSRPVFNDIELNQLREKFNNSMDDIIERALRENNYPSFSLWDFDNPPGFEENFRLFYNSHGFVFVFFNLVEAKKDIEKCVKKVLSYLKPVDLMKCSGKDFKSKIMLIGTNLDLVINDGIDKDLENWLALYEEMEAAKRIDSGAEDTGHVSFLESKLAHTKEKAKVDVITAVKKTLLAMNVHFEDALKGYSDIVPDDASNTLFFALSNNLPTICETIEEDFDDITGINKFRRKVKNLIDAGNVEVLQIMRSLKDCKVIDALMVRRQLPQANEDDMRSKYIDLQSLAEIAANAGISSRADLVVLLRYLDVTGVVSWLNFNTHLQNLIVLDPNYIVDGLKEFYEACGPNGKEYLEKQIKTETEGNKTGLIEDLKNAMAHRLVSSDLLTQKLLPREKAGYFQALLEHTFHINKTSTKLLSRTYGEHSFSTVTDDEVFLVPNFGSEPEAPQVGLKIFDGQRAKFVPKNGLYLKGTFERAFVRLLETLNIVVTDISPDVSKNQLHYSDGFARFDFGKFGMTMTQLYGKGIEEQGYIVFDFTDDGSVDKLFKYVEAIMRKLNAEVYPGCSLAGFVHCNGGWVEVDTASKELLKPFYVSKGVSHDKLEEMNDTFNQI